MKLEGPLSFEEDRLHHPAGRPRPSRARRHAGEDPRARGPGRRGGGARRRDRPRRAARQLPPPPLRRGHEGRARGPVRERARAGAAPGARAGDRPHVPDLRGARRAARAAARDPARALVHALAGRPHAAAGRAPLVGDRERRHALLPAPLAQGRPDRARDRHARVRLRRPPARPRSCARSRSAATRPRRGSTR